jgi:nucleoside triphosphate pyrophosphatase
MTGIEEARAGSGPTELVLANARAKARAAAEAGAVGLILGADTEVVLDGALLGKATDEDGARRRLLALSGRTHEVLTALVLLDTESAGERSGVERTAVGFRPVEGAFLERYLASGEWRDRAGAYAVQGLGAAMVETVDGDLANVIGMPVGLFLQLVPQFHLKP